VRNYCGHILPEGLIKNQQLDEIKLTPTTKSDEHDELISAEEVVSNGLMTQQDWDTCSSYAHSLFRRGQQLAAETGLILVDCKYEFG
jgi:phosphoribosylaminoimidazole-succinocarboxamide synthase